MVICARINHGVFAKKKLLLYFNYVSGENVVESLRVKNPTSNLRKSHSRNFGKRWTTHSLKLGISPTIVLSLFSSKQQKGESVESFYRRLIEQAQNCSLGDEETTSIRDAFILNMQDPDIQRE